MGKFKTLGNKLVNVDEICSIVRFDGKPNNDDYGYLFMIGVIFKNNNYQTIYRTTELGERERKFIEIENILKGE